MEAPLSTYWVKFFKNAGFPSDVAARHALIFSNNRIKPDMLPDLDKPSLKEMGITLMGDMIAILRYAKKVVEETSCKKFLVNSEDSPSSNKMVTKPVVKKLNAKPIAKPSNAKVKVETTSKVLRPTSSSIVKPNVTIKKKVSPITQTSRMYSDYMETEQRPRTSPLKRKYSSDEDDDIDGKWGRIEPKKHIKLSNNEVKYTVTVPKETMARSQKILKKAVDNKRTVFHRLGDSMVSSTTNIDAPSSTFTPTFSITGIGSDTIKRNSSVFKRLGSKDLETTTPEFTRFIRNGYSAGVNSPGILKTPLTFGTKILTTNSLLKKPIGTMRADEEANKKAMSTSVRQLIRTTKSLKFNDNSVRSSSFTKKIPITGKLASESVMLPAKSRLGVTKQVTFNNKPTVTHIRKQGVFSRLGV